jgi:hypothetical protein
MNKGNKLSAYWNIRLFLERGLYSPFIAFLMVILVGSEQLNVSTVFWVLTSLFLLYCIGKLSNTINVLLGKFDMNQFNYKQNQLRVVVVYHSNDKYLFASLVSDFEARVMYEMWKQGWLCVKNKKVSWIEVYNYDYLSEEDKANLYIDSTNQEISKIVYSALLSKDYRKTIMNSELMKSKNFI